MQREIKFRVYDTEKKELSYGFSIQDLASEVCYAVVAAQDRDELVWQQYTGLKDKNGVEIYEGDILGYPESFDDKTLLEIKWATAYSGGQWCEFVIQNREGKAFDNQDKPNDFYGGIHPDYMIVVGNIFEGVKE